MRNNRVIAVVGQRVLSRNDEAWAPGKASRLCASGLDGDEARRDVADETGELGRQGEQEGRGGFVWHWEAPSAA
jgi:hypothetical protein